MSTAERADYLLPDLNELGSLPFWEGCAKGELRVQRCVDCELVCHPPRPMCPGCRSIQREWVATSGKGRIWSFINVHPPLLPAYSPLAPFPVIVVELEENPKIRFVGNIVSEQDAPINSIDPTSLAIGQPVRVIFELVDDVTLPRWIAIH